MSISTVFCVPDTTFYDCPNLFRVLQVYDCCVSLDGIPIKQEFQYTLSDPDGYGKITQHVSPEHTMRVIIVTTCTRVIPSRSGSAVQHRCRKHRVLNNVISCARIRPYS